MATIQNPIDEQNQGPGTAANQPISGTGASGTSAKSAGVNQGPVSPVQQNVAPQGNQGYTDVSAYLNANPQGGQQIGQGVASNLTQGYNDAKTGIDTSVASANQAISSGYIPENTQLIQQAESNPTSFAYNATTTPGSGGTLETEPSATGMHSGVIQMQQPSTTTYTPNQNNIDAFQAQLNDTYTGPSNWSDLGTLQGQVQTAQQNANLLNMPGGNNALIQQYENTINPGQTSQGINALDTLLFQGDPNAVQTAQTAAQPYAGLTDYLNQQASGIQNNIGNAQNATQQTSQDALNAFTGANGTLTNLNTDINNTAAQDLTAAQQQQQQLQNDLTNLYSNGNKIGTSDLQNYNVGSLSPQDLAALGMTADQGVALQKALQTAGTSQFEAGHNFGEWSQTGKEDLLQYLQQQDPTKAITAGTVATPEQYQQMAAINQLLGSKAPVQGEAINPLNASQAATYSPGNLNQFNYGAATSDATNYAQAAQQAALQKAFGETAAADAAHAASKGGWGNIGTWLDAAKNYAINPLTVVPTEINAAKKKV